VRPLLYLDDDDDDDEDATMIGYVWHIYMYLLYNTGHNGAIASMICGSGSLIGDAMVRDRRIELVSFTGR
jgi:hypothetical protein